MKGFLILLLAAVVIPGPAVSQDWRAELAEELVSVQDGKMVYQEYGILRITLEGYEPYSAQVKFYSEAPAGGAISRDNFVGFTTMFVTTLLMAGYAEAFQVPASTFMQGYDFSELANPIGNPDVEISIYMTDEGFQFEWVDTASGQTTRETMTWAEVYGSQ